MPIDRREREKVNIDKYQSPTTIILSPATFEKVFGTMNSLGSLAKGVMNRAVSIPSDINDVVMDNVMPLVDSLADTISNDADITQPYYAKGEIRKRKLRTQGRNEKPRLTQRYPEKRRVRRRKRIRKENPQEEVDDRLRNHKIDFFSETMEKYLKHRKMLAEGAMKVGQVDKFVSSLAEEIKKVGMEKELNDTDADLIAMPKVDILKTD